MKPEFWQDYHRQSIGIKAATIIGMAIVLLYLYW